MKFDAYNRDTDVLVIVHPTLLEAWKTFADTKRLTLTPEKQQYQLLTGGVAQVCYGFTLDATDAARKAVTEFLILQP